MNLTPEKVKQAARDAGGIVHSDGNIFFTNSDKLLAAVALLRSAGDGWQDIATAPRDGTTLLLAGKKNRVADGDWHSVAKAWNWPYVNAEPTHWMPLPPVPGQEGGETC